MAKSLLSRIFGHSDEDDKALPDEVILAVNTLIAEGRLKLNDLLPGKNAKLVGRSDFDAFFKRLATENGWADLKTGATPTQPMKKILSDGFVLEAANSMKLMVAKWHGTPIGVAFDSQETGFFVLALTDFTHCLNIDKARYEARKLSAPAGYKWIVPSDEHFRVIQKNAFNVNVCLRCYDGTPLSNAYLSSTSQNNRPSWWAVRFVLVKA